MKTKLLTLLTLLVCVCTGAWATPTTIASWTFNTGYDFDDVNKVYTPNGGEYTGTDAIWFATYAPNIRPQTYVGTQSNYKCTALSTSRYWQMRDNGNGEKILRIENTTGNNITDYTDGSKHNVYFQYSFPTTGYCNITFSYGITFGNNKAVPIELVYSTDGGTTWVDYGSNNTSSQWWTFTNYDIKLPVSNETNVIVRLIAGNGEASNWNMKECTVTGEALDAEKSVITFYKPSDAVGSVPASQTIDINTSYTIPINNSLSKVGYTLTGWNDGTNTYSIGSSYTMSQMAYDLQPVFTANTAALGCDAATTVNWTFKTSEGAPSLSFQTASSPNAYVYPKQVTIDGVAYDGLMTIDASESGAKFANTSNSGYAQVTANTKFTIPAVKGMVITFKCNQPGSTSAVSFDGHDADSYDSSARTLTYTYNGTDESIDIIVNNGNLYPEGISISYPLLKETIATSSGNTYATYVTKNKLNFEDVTGMTAYIVTGKGENVIITEAVTKVPANTPILVKTTEAGSSKDIPHTATASLASTNKLKASDGSVTGDGSTIYGFFKVGSEYGFAPVASGTTLAAGKAYLQIEGGALQARFLALDLEGETTGINAVNGEGLTVNGSIFDLQGRKVAQPTRGLYIVNGKKVVIK